MRFAFIYTLVVLILTSGCTAVPAPTGTVVASAATAVLPTPPRHADRSLALNEARVHLNVRGGSWSELESKSEKSQTFALVLQRSNQYDRWAAVQSVCVKGTMPGKMACLKVMQRQQGVNLLGVEMTVGPHVNVIPQTTAIDGAFVLGEEVIVKIDIGASDIQFAVNGKHVFTQAIDFATDKIRYGCSSAECIFTLL